MAIRAYVDLAPQVSGVIASISPALRAGGTFKANEVLVSIDAKDFELRLKQALAEVASARSNLQLQQAKSDNAKRNYALLHPKKAVPPLSHCNHKFPKLEPNSQAPSPVQTLQN